MSLRVSLEMCSHEGVKNPVIEKYLSQPDCELRPLMVRVRGKVDPSSAMVLTSEELSEVVLVEYFIWKYWEERNFIMTMPSFNEPAVMVAKLRRCAECLGVGFVCRPWQANVLCPDCYNKREANLSEEEAAVLMALKDTHSIVVPPRHSKGLFYQEDHILPGTCPKATLDRLVEVGYLSRQEDVIHRNYERQVCIYRPTRSRCKV